jgi:hypothetical protein
LAQRSPLLSLEFLRAYETASWIQLDRAHPPCSWWSPLWTASPTASSRQQPSTTHCTPKKLVLIPGGHFDPYWGTGFGPSSVAARDWFVDHLITKI